MVIKATVDPYSNRDLASSEEPSHRPGKMGDNKTKCANFTPSRVAPNRTVDRGLQKHSDHTDPEKKYTYVFVKKIYINFLRQHWSQVMNVG